MTRTQPRAAMKPGPIRKWLRARMLSSYLYTLTRDEKTLDLGCGWGFSFSINPAFYGVDMDQASLRYCVQQGFKVARIDLLKPLPFGGGCFDNVFSHDVLEHFELQQVHLIFAGVYSVLRSGGTFMNVIPNRKGYDYGLRLDIGHKHFMTPAEIRDIATVHGFSYLDDYSVPVPAFMNGWFTHAKYVTICQKR